MSMNFEKSIYQECINLLQIPDEDLPTFILMMLVTLLIGTYKLHGYVYTYLNALTLKGLD